MTFFESAMIVLAVISIASELLKIGYVNSILKIVELDGIYKDKSLEDDVRIRAHKDMTLLFAYKPMILVAIVSDFFYWIFAFVVLFTPQWYLGVVLFILTVLQLKVFKLGKKSIIADSVLCILLLLIYIVTTIM